VLVEPEIPQNTGNIVRSCAVTGAQLHLIRPLGFSVEDKYLKRAGLDYWWAVEPKFYNSFEELKEKYSGNQFFYATTKSSRLYSEASYEKNCFIVFGKETKGLPIDLLKQNEQNCIRIPMKPGLRSLNLANSVSIVLYEALRQQGFPGLIASDILKSSD
jgi:tRNA (cytidine/uridine-2'-O-)-methyltransferase